MEIQLKTSPQVLNLVENSSITCLRGGGIRIAKNKNDVKHAPVLKDGDKRTLTKGMYWVFGNYAITFFTVEHLDKKEPKDEPKTSKVQARPTEKPCPNA